MRILDQPRPAVVDEHDEPVLTRRGPHPSDAFVVQVAADRLAVMTEMTGDRRDRPTSLAERVSVHIVLLCEHGTGLPRWLAVVEDSSLEGAPPRRVGPTQVGRFSEQL